MSKTLIIVESPKKQKQLSGYLGSKYVVLATVGHIMDLPSNKMGIDFKNNFELTYEVYTDKKKVVADIKKAHKECSEVILATDLDREGEFIAWCLQYILKLKNPKRISFGDTTKATILKSLKNPKEIDINLVYAQQTRRTLDRYIGYGVSPLLQEGKSAGRVQSVIVRVIVDKEKEIIEFNKKGSENYYKMHGDFICEKKDMNGNLCEINKTGMAKIKTKDEIMDLIEEISGSKLVIKSIEEKEVITNPPIPFTTATLQAEANKKLHLVPKDTMRIAQKLYETGLITYIRTDSVELSDEFLENAKKYIIEKHGNDYYRLKKYKSKVQNSQEAHEAIRPTNINNLNPENLNDLEIKVYILIWKKSIASQMSPAKYNELLIGIEIKDNKEYYFLNKSKTLLFDGYLILYNAEVDEKLKINFKIGDKVELKKLIANQEYESPPSRYNYASITEILAKKGIVRPATGANFLSLIEERGYVTKTNIEGEKKSCLNLIWENDEIEEEEKNVFIGKEKNILKPTELGEKVNIFLLENFSELIDVEFTVNMEKNLDKIAKGELNKIQILQEFYEKINPLMEKIIPKKIKKYNHKVLGVNEKTGNEIFVLKTKYGDAIKTKINDKDIFVSIKEPYSIETLKLEDAMKLLEYPKFICNYNNCDIYLYNGQNGLYFKYNNKTYSIKDPTEENVINIIKEKEKNIIWTKTSGTTTYTILNGKYDKPYLNVKSKKENKNIPLKNFALDKITLKSVKEYIKKI